MLLSKDIKLNIGIKNIKRLKDRYNLDKLVIPGDIVSIPLDILAKNSHLLVDVSCDYCGILLTVPYKRYNLSIKDVCKYSCSRKECSSEKIKDVCMRKYGVSNPFKLESVKDKSKITLLERFGVEHQMYLDETKNKIKNTCNIRYGVDSYNKTNSSKESIKKTNIEKYGVDHPLKSEIIKSKLKETNIKKYGASNYKKSEKSKVNTKIGSDLAYINYIGSNISLFRCNKSHNFEINSYIYSQRSSRNLNLCTICYPIGDQKSIKEKELLEFIKDNYSGDIISGYRDGLEIDIYLPELKIGFEFNGLYWHSEKYKDKNYHLNKTNHFKEKGIRIIHIWEDDFDFRRSIVKSKILNSLGKSKKIYASKCRVKEVSLEESKEFLDNNHIQGDDISMVKLGLYYNETLVSVMTFDKFEGHKKMEEGGYNLSRFCNLCNHNIVGASKLLNYFINQYNPIRIVSYVDKDWSVTQLYYTLGFRNINESKPDYKYIVDNKRVHKSRYRKEKIGIEEKKKVERVIYKIYDCGKVKFEYKKSTL